ncbi:MAG: GNAT family N-acetyltransferase [Candidatus Ranarchaeia archaeon]
MEIAPINSGLIPKLSVFVRENKSSVRLSSIKKIKTEINSRSRQNWIWLAKTKNRVGGYVWVTKGKIGQRGAHYPKPAYISILELFVAPSLRRRRIGSQLLETVHKHGIQEGSPIFLVDVEQDNWVAQKFLEKNGYEMILRWKWKGNDRLRFKRILR